MSDKVLGTNIVTTTTLWYGVEFETYTPTVKITNSGNGIYGYRIFTFQNGIQNTIAEQAVESYADNNTLEIPLGTVVGRIGIALNNDNHANLTVTLAGLQSDLIVGPFADIPAANAWAAANPSSLFPGLLATAGGVQVRWGGAGSGGWAADNIHANICRLGVVGDSIDVYGGGIGLALASVSGGRIIRAVSVATAGDTSTDQLGKISGLSGHSLDYVTIKLGTNDAHKNSTPNYVPVSTYVSNLEAIGDYVLSIGAMPIFITPPPNSSSGAAYIPAYVRAMEGLCYRRGWFCSRRWRKINDGTAAYKSGASFDNIHPYTHHLYSEAAELLSELSASGIFPAQRKLKPWMNSGDVGGKFANSLFLTDSNSDGLADSVTKLGSGTTSLIASTFGNRQNVDVTSASGNQGLSISLSGLTIGRKYLLQFTATVSVSSGTMRFVTYNACSGVGLYANPSPAGAFNLTSAEGNATISYSEEFIATATSGTLNVYDPGSGASFVLGVEEFQCWDLLAIDMM